jgi:hypothetical protein
VDCPNLRELRRELKGEVGDLFNSVSSLLGGSKQGERGKPHIVSRARTVKAVLDFAEASQRFRRTERYPHAIVITALELGILVNEKRYDTIVILDGEFDVNENPCEYIAWSAWKKTSHTFGLVH